MSGWVCRRRLAAVMPSSSPDGRHADVRQHDVRRLRLDRREEGRRRCRRTPRARSRAPSRARARSPRGPGSCHRRAGRGSRIPGPPGRSRPALVTVVVGWDLVRHLTPTLCARYASRQSSPRAHSRIPRYGLPDNAHLRGRMDHGRCAPGGPGGPRRRSSQSIIRNPANRGIVASTRPTTRTSAAAASALGRAVRVDHLDAHDPGAGRLPGRRPERHEVPDDPHHVRPRGPRRPPSP